MQQIHDAISISMTTIPVFWEEREGGREREKEGGRGRREGGERRGEGWGRGGGREREEEEGGKRREGKGGEGSREVILRLTYIHTYIMI